MREVPVDQADSPFLDRAGLRSLWSPFSSQLTFIEGLRQYLGSGEKENLAGLFNQRRRRFYPVVFTSYWLEHQMWGLDARGYHAVNLGLHVLNVLLALLFLRSLGAPLGVCAAAAAVFAVHPVQVASVAWVSERKNTLSGTFFLLSSVLYLRHRRSRPPIAWMMYVACCAAFALALLSKPQVLTLPLILLVADLVLQRLQRLPRLGFSGLAARIAPLLALSLVAAQLTVLSEQAASRAAAPFTAAQRPFVVAAAGWHYVATLVAPFHLSPLYPRWNVAPFGPLPAAAVWWVALLSWPLVGYGLYRVRRRVPDLVWLGMAECVLTLVPVLGFVNFNYQQFSPVADHFLYLACIGFGLMVAVLVEAVVPPSAPPLRRRLVALVAVGLFVWAAAATRRESHYWRDNQSFWTHVLVRNPDSFPANLNLGNHFRRFGMPAQGLPYLRRATDIDPGNEVGLYGYLRVLEEVRGIAASASVCQQRFEMAQQAEREGRQHDAFRIYNAIAVAAPGILPVREQARRALERLRETP